MPPMVHVLYRPCTDDEKSLPGRPDDGLALLSYCSTRAGGFVLTRQEAAGKWGATTYAVIMGQRFRWSRELRECSATLERAFADVERADLGPGLFDDFAFLITPHGLPPVPSASSLRSTRWPRR